MKIIEIIFICSLVVIVFLLGIVIGYQIGMLNCINMYLLEAELRQKVEIDRYLDKKDIEINKIDKKVIIETKELINEEIVIVKELPINEEVIMVKELPTEINENDIETEVAYLQILELKTEEGLLKK